MKNGTNEGQSGKGFLAHANQGPNSESTEIAARKEKSAIESALVVAKQFPRDQVKSHMKIMEACKRPSLAEQSQYSYPRGGVQVTGPSVRLAEVLAQNWGNIRFGYSERERSGGSSVMIAYCWDMENNVLAEQEFRVKHWRDKRGGGVQLTDERDIYEITANQGSRRLRAQILKIIPGDVVDAAIDQCNKTLAGGDGGPLLDRVKHMAALFANIGVTEGMLEQRLGHNLAATSLMEVTNYGKIYKSIVDEMSSVGDWFEPVTKQKDASSPKDDNLPGLPSEPDQPDNSKQAELGDEQEWGAVETELESNIKDLDGIIKADDELTHKSVYAELRKRHILEDGENLSNLTLERSRQVIGNWKSISEAIKA